MFSVTDRIDLLAKWLERNGSLATYRKLAECLYEAGAIETLQVLCEELGGNLQQASASNVVPNSPLSTHQSLNPHCKSSYMVYYLNVLQPCSR